MQGAISTIDALERFFKGAGAPFFTLSYYSTQSPTGQGSVIIRSVKEGNIDNAWENLRKFVQDQTGFGRAQLHLITYEKENGANTPSARTNIDIGGNTAQAPGTPGIGSLPVGYVTEDAIEKAIAAAKEKWDMEAKIQTLENQPEDSFMEKVERIAAIPTVQAIVNAFLAKQGLPQIPAPAMKGVHSPDNETVPDDQDNFDEDINATARILGVTDAQLAYKLRKLAEADPMMARQIFNQ